jgi:hypothetical protein
MKAISVSLLLLILISSIVTITEVNASKATDKGERITEKAKDKAEDIGDKLRALGGQNNNYNDNDNENIQNEFDNSKDEDNTFSKNNDNDKVSIADELRELAQLKKEGIITEEEFTEMKEDLIEEKK